MSIKDPRFTNALIHETSPYLLQHAHNPVDWMPWDDAVLATAKKENKLIIVSIGYSACHWCHVMEEESFENEDVAQVMNTSYISIKVDREERPDVDSIYMNAIQLMNGRGGWPLNMVALPDGRPVWGATYVPRENWMDALKQIDRIKQEDPAQLEAYANRLEVGIKQMSIIKANDKKHAHDKNILDNAVSQWSQQFDLMLGGMRRAPKFMMPNNYEFLLRYAVQHKNEPVLDFVKTTLELMAFGGVYDQVGGGFSRYSVDEKWHVPHFEKMLYDNAQLLSLYSKAYLVHQSPLYKETVYDTITFLQREMLDPSGGFYAALDADSINTGGKREEGAYYVWTQPELKSLLKDDYALFAAYYNINAYGHWEHGNYVLIRQDNDEDFIARYHLDAAGFASAKETWRKKLLAERQKRETPRLDDKILAGWNGLTLTGLVDAHTAFGESQFLDLAIHNAQFIEKKLMRQEGGLYRNHKAGSSTINAYLEDYAAVIEGFINVFQATGNKKWLDHAIALTEYVIVHFYNPENGMFFFTSDEDTVLIARNTEYLDNVIPSSNSIMAKNLFKLAHLTLKKEYEDKAARMLDNMLSEASTYAGSYSNWLDLLLNFTHPFNEIVIAGPKARELKKELDKSYLPSAIKVFALSEIGLDILKNRFAGGDTLIYVCRDYTCKLPVRTVKEALEAL
ncbi:MAG: thioredoxin domain-containing protein [Cytophagaceae bacterium]|nr:thioredoxin domain-containing protein [Cytophagaceae bacterium]|tara:strand:- start:3367 stop:5406 length:2040 start_codon:yes stop_codon:yes gene_type:complete